MHELRKILEKKLKNKTATFEYIEDVKALRIELGVEHPMVSSSTSSTNSNPPIAETSHYAAIMEMQMAHNVSFLSQPPLPIQQQYMPYYYGYSTLLHVYSTS